ncbi:MAG: isoaspartyl peptidase/L-asparaginase [Planctomycetes bacterium]|nr:isoaspartyl peptidase/L-asparaginase [Planctomycetota bacterium]
MSGGVVLVHGGAGLMRTLEGARLDAYREGLAESARQGRAALERGGDAVEAVLAAVRALEASGVFNAGAGACLDEDGAASLDAALMRGRDRAAGAVGACAATVHPTDVARDLMDEGRHVLLVGDGADRRARRLGLPPLPPPTPERLEAWARLSGRHVTRPEDLTSVGQPEDQAAAAGPDPDGDTVGAVALDGRGRLAGAVSTGGLWLKARGRVGDSALPGAGVYACDDLGAAASATGVGERMIRAVTCKLACDLAGRDGAEVAARRAVDDLERRFGADSGGLIVLDRLGRVGAAFNTHGMGRALARAGDPAVVVAVWPEDPFPTG